MNKTKTLRQYFAGKSLTQRHNQNILYGLPRQESQNQSSALTQLYGTYRGFAPTDESPIAMGELEIILSNSSMKIRMATGLKIDYAEIPASELKPMDKKAIQDVYVEGSHLAEQTIGFEANGIKYLFFQNTEAHEPPLFILGSMGDFLGPTFLFSPKQVENGTYQKAADLIRTEMGFFPTLANNGQMPEEYYSQK